MRHLKAAGSRVQKHKISKISSARQGYDHSKDMSTLGAHSQVIKIERQGYDHLKGILNASHGLVMLSRPKWPLEALAL